MKNIKLFFLVIAILASSNLAAQVAVTNDGSSADGSAMLEVKSTSKGLLPPRVTEAEMYAIADPAEGLIVYCTDYNTNGCLMVYSNSIWKCLFDGVGNLAPVASNVSFTGTLEIGRSLIGSYTYTDNESDPEGASLYQWYCADDASGTNEAAISGATSLTYTLAAADETKYISFEVIPVAQTGARSGTAVLSTYQGPVTQYIWTCGESFIDARDGQSYTTVQIGTQCWMAENLNFGTMISTSLDQTDNSVYEKYCYSNSSANCDTYGGLYQYMEAAQYGVFDICPAGWDLANNDQWCLLFNYVDTGPTISCSQLGFVGTDVGGHLKETGTVHWGSPNTGATNSSGFTALGAGFTSPDGTGVFLRGWGRFWSADMGGGITGYSYTLLWHEQRVERQWDNINNGYSLRCIKD